MRGIIWWIRSGFCKHEWKHLRDMGMHPVAADGTVSKDPSRTIRSKECVKCGWIWRQEI